MQAKLISSSAASDLRLHAVILDSGDELVSCILEFARAQQLSAAHCSDGIPSCSGPPL